MDTRLNQSEQQAIPHAVGYFVVYAQHTKDCGAVHAKRGYIKQSKTYKVQQCLRESIGT